MTLKTGQDAPDFDLYTDEKELFKLSDYRGQHVLLLFFPGAFTSVCTDELNAVNNELDAYETSDVQVVGISTDSPFVLAEFRNVNSIDFPLLSDHNAHVASQYGTKYNHDFTPMQLDRVAKRAAFLIDDEGIIRYAEVLDNAGEQPDFDAIKETLRSLA